MISFEHLQVRFKGVYYGWWVLAASGFLAAVVGGIFFRGFTVFFLPIQRDLKLSRASTSVIFALAGAEGGVSGPLIGWLIDRLGSRPLIIAGGLLAGTGYILLSQVQGYAGFLLIYLGMVSFGISTGLDPTLMAAVNRWFVRRKAIALSMLLTCYPLGGAVFVPLLALGISRIGWRSLSLYIGILLISIVIPPALLIRKSPESAGIPVDAPVPGRDRVPGGRPAGVSEVTYDYSVGEAVRTRSFWLLVGASTLRITVNAAIVVHLVPILVWKGTDEFASANLAALLFFLTIGTRLLAGFLAGRFPLRWLLTGGMTSSTLALAGLILLDGGWVSYLFIVGIAIGEICSPLNWVTFGTFFGRSSFATLFGITGLFYGVGMLVSPVYAGWIFDETGSYDTALATFVLLHAVSAALYVLTGRPKPPERVPTPAAA